jgi:hypothetical protein
VRLRAPMLVVGLALLSGCGSTSGDSSPASRIRGRLTLGPGCAVQQDSRDCPDQAISGQVTARVAPASKQTTGSDTAIVAETSTDADGGFELAVPPGDYILEATTTATRFGCTPLRVHVGSDEVREVALRCDTGIRDPQ